METLILVLGWLVLIFLGMPVAPALIIACLSFMMYAGYGLSFATQRMVDALNSFSLLAIPLFIFAGNLFNSSKITSILFEFAKKTCGTYYGRFRACQCAGEFVFLRHVGFCHCGL